MTPKLVSRDSEGKCELTHESWKKAQEGLREPRSYIGMLVNPLTPELNPSAQRCMTRSFTGDFASLTVHFFNIFVKNQQIHQLFIQFINYVW
jgi:hypothetical protein